jgi:undecaprenyl diphosphate synthase
MLWQLAYTEMFFTNTLWPSFAEEELFRAIDWFGQRDRRFGGTNSVTDAASLRLAKA